MTLGPDVLSGRSLSGSLLHRNKFRFASVALRPGQAVAAFLAAGMTPNPDILSGRSLSG